MYALFNTQRLPNNKGKMFRTMATVLYKLIPSPKVRYKIWKHAEREMSKYSWDECEYVTELIGSVKGMLYKHPKKWFASQKWVDFEGYKVPVMAGYDHYLTRICSVLPRISSTQSISLSSWIWITHIHIIRIKNTSQEEKESSEEQCNVKCCCDFCRRYRPENEFKD